jgi:lipocalin-like protein
VRGTLAAGCLAGTLLAVALLAAPAQAFAKKRENPLVGTWRLRSWENQRSDGKTELPYGVDPIAFIVWTPGGRWIFLLQMSKRVNFAVPRIQAGTPDEKRAAFETSLAYGGTYVYDEKAGVVTLKVDASTFPNWTGTETRRFVEVKGRNRYLARTAPFKVGEVDVVVVLDWERVE